MKDYEIDVIEIKEILKKMQEDIKILKNSIPFYPTAYQYNPERLKDYPTCDNWQSCSVPTTQACSEEELLK